MFVLDAATGAADEAPVTERAQFLISKFAGDADPYDIIDTTDLALTLSAGRWPRTSARCTPPGC